MARRISAGITLADPEATVRFAERLAPLLVAGDVLLLDGPLGAGKTHLARALIQARLARHDAVEDVPSPSFTLVQTYQAGALEIWHADLYRLSDPSELWELGLEEAFDTALCLVEWPDRLGSAAPASALTLSLAIAGETARTLRIEGAADRWAGRLDTLLPEPADDR